MDLVVRAGLQGVAVDGLVSANILVGESNVLAVHGTDATSKLQQKTTMESRIKAHTMLSGTERSIAMLLQRRAIDGGGHIVMARTRE